MLLTEESLPFLEPIFDELAGSNWSIHNTKIAVAAMKSEVPGFDEMLRSCMVASHINPLEDRPKIEEIMALMLRMFVATSLNYGRLHRIVNNVCVTAVDTVVFARFSDRKNSPESDGDGGYYLNIFVPSPDSHRMSVLSPDEFGTHLFKLSKTQKKVVHPLWRLGGRCMAKDYLYELVYGTKERGRNALHQLVSNLNKVKLRRCELCVVLVRDEGYALRELQSAS